MSRLVRDLRAKGCSEWTAVGVFRIANATFRWAVRHKILTANPCEALEGDERPRQRNAKEIRVLSAEELARLVAATKSDRWRCAVALAGYEGLRLSELRGLKWADVDFKKNALYVRRSLAPDGEELPTKTQAGERTITLFPAARRVLRKWHVASPHSKPSDFVLTTAEGASVQQRNLRRTLAAAIADADIEVPEGARLSFHSLRHSAGSIWLSELGLALTTASKMLGHANTNVTAEIYGHESRDDDAVIADVLARARKLGVAV